jgi:hypothetical protein
VAAVLAVCMAIHRGPGLGAVRGRGGRTDQTVVERSAVFAGAGNAWLTGKTAPRIAVESSAAVGAGVGVGLGCGRSGGCLGGGYTDRKNLLRTDGISVSIGICGRVYCRGMALTILTNWALNSAKMRVYRGMAENWLQE